jgi:pimeloyl-[acyl-carrier protein] methyl ester esterase
VVSNKQTKLVLLPGIDGTGKMFGPLIEQIPEGQDYQVIAYPTDKNYSYLELKEYVLAQLPADGAFYIVAESFAGPLSLMLSQSLADRLKGLVLVATFLTNPRPVLGTLTRPFIRDWMMGMKPNKLLARFFVVGFDIPDEMLVRALAFHETVPPSVVRHRLFQVFDVDVRSIYKECPVPVLHLYGKKDRLLLQGCARQMRRIRPDVPSIGIDGPHYLLQARPEQCMQHIQEFIKQHPNRYQVVVRRE